MSAKRKASKKSPKKNLEQSKARPSASAKKKAAAPPEQKRGAGSPVGSAKASNSNGAASRGAGSKQTPWLGFMCGAALITVCFVALLILNRIPILKVGRKLAAARAAVADGDLEKAREIYQPLAEGDVHNATPQLELANVILRQAQNSTALSDEKNDLLEEALKTFLGAYKADPLSVSIRQGIAAVYVEMQRERISLLDRSGAALRPEFKAKVINEIEDLGRQAVKLLQEAERIEPDNSGTSAQLATIFEENDDRWSAAKRYAGLVYDERYGDKARTHLQKLEAELLQLAGSRGTPATTQTAPAENN